MRTPALPRAAVPERARRCEHGRGIGRKQFDVGWITRIEIIERRPMRALPERFALAPVRRGRGHGRDPFAGAAVAVFAPQGLDRTQAAGALCEQAEAAPGREHIGALAAHIEARVEHRIDRAALGVEQQLERAIIEMHLDRRRLVPADACHEPAVLAHEACVAAIAEMQAELHRAEFLRGGGHDGRSARRERLDGRHHQLRRVLNRHRRLPQTRRCRASRSRNARRRPRRTTGTGQPPRAR